MGMRQELNLRNEVILRRRMAGGKKHFRCTDWEMRE